MTSLSGVSLGAGPHPLSVLPSAVPPAAASILLLLPGNKFDKLLLSLYPLFLPNRALRELRICSSLIWKQTQLLLNTKQG